MNRWMPWRTWLHGLGAAAIGGSASAITAAVGDPQTFNLSHSGLISLMRTAIVAGLLTGVAYLVKSPLP
ncbi:MAG TPA: hypothetical protein VGR96_15750 [Acidobacteriaceae bacterium]|nr:hypothetical protein [Acidobacteriaceae bacterium]